MHTAIPSPVETLSRYNTQPKTAPARPKAPRMDMNVPVKSLGINNTKRPQPDRGLIKVIPESIKRRKQSNRKIRIILALVSVDYL